MPTNSLHADDPVIDRRGRLAERVDFNQIPRSELTRDPHGRAYMAYHEKTDTAYPLPPHIYDLLFPYAVEDNKKAFAELRIGEEDASVKTPVHPDSVAALMASLNPEPQYTPQKIELLQIATGSIYSEDVPIIDTGNHDGRIQSVILQKSGTFRRSRFARSS